MPRAPFEGVRDRRNGTRLRWLRERLVATRGRRLVFSYGVVVLAVVSGTRPIVIVPVRSWSKLTSRGLRFALELSEDVRALHVLTQDTTICELTAVWEELVAGPAREAGLAVPRLVLKKSTYRQFFAPLIDYVEQVRDDHVDRDVILIVPDLVVRRWYHAFLHNNRGAVLRALVRRRGGARVVVVNTPFYLAD